MKTFNDETIKDQDLPEGINWKSIIERPTTLSDLNWKDGDRLDDLDIFSDQETTAVPTGFSVSEKGISTADDGTISAYVVLTWNANSEDNFDSYAIRYKQSSFTYYNYISTKETTITIEGLLPNKEYDFSISSVNKYGIQSNFGATVTETMSTSTTPPDTVTGVVATGGIQYVIVQWTSNTEADLSSYNVYRNTSDNSGTATLIANVRTNYFVDGDKTGGVEYFYWVKAVNTSGLESTNFSVVDSGTPRNVESEDVEVIAAEKILIDGEVLLTNWRKSGDLTKIDGGSISTGTVTTEQLNFTPVDSDNILATINASEEGLEISADRININGKSYFTDDTGARVEIFPDADTGIKVLDDLGNEVFKTIIGGTHVGDVYIGDYAGNQGMFYDKSADKFYFRGDINAGDITAGTISADRISGLTDDNIDSINFSNITASGTITGATIRTSSGTTRVEMAVSDNTLKVYKSGIIRTSLGEEFINFRDSSGDVSGSIYGSGDGIVTIATGNIDYMFRFDSNTFIPGWSGMSIGADGSEWPEIYADDLFLSSINKTGGQTIQIGSDSSGNYVNIDHCGDIETESIIAYDACVFKAGVAFDSGAIKMGSLPTSEPSTAGFLWRDGNTVKVST